MKRFSLVQGLVLVVSLVLVSQGWMGCGSITLQPPPLDDVIPKDDKTKTVEPPVTKPPVSKNDSWVLTSGGSSYSAATHALTDDAGNSYVTGYFRNYMVMGAVTVRSRFGLSLFVAKVNSQGKTLWVREASFKFKDRKYANYYQVSPKAFAINNQGQIAVGVEFGNGGIVLDDGKRAQKEGNTLYVAQISSEGKWDWIQAASNAGRINLVDISISSSGVVTVVGNFSGDLTWGEQTLKEPVSRSLTRAYVCQFDKQGNVIALKKLTSGQDYLSLSAVASLSQGDILLMGNYSGALQLGKFSLPAPEGRNSYVAVIKMNSQGDILSATHIGGFLPFVQRATVDNEGNVFMTGRFSTSIVLGSLTLSKTNSRSTNVFVTKWTKNGKFAWAKAMTPGYIATTGLHISTNSQGELLFASSFSAKFSLGSFTLAPDPKSETGSYQQHSFLARFSPKGDVLWASKAGSNIRVTGAGWNQGKMVAVGNCSDQCSLFANKMDAQNSQTVNVASMNTDGSQGWLTSTKGLPTAAFHSVHVDAKGRSYLVGLSGGNWKHQSKAVEGPINVLSLTQLDTKGNLQWSLPIKDIYNSKTTVDAEGNTYIAGMISGPSVKFGSFQFSPGSTSDFIIAKISPKGTIVWAKSIQDTEQYPRRRQSNNISDIVVDAKGTITLLAEYGQSSLEMDEMKLKLENNRKLLLVRMDTKGKLLWFKSFGGESQHTSVGINTNHKGELFLRGQFSGTLSIDGIGTYKSANYYGSYVAKLSPEGTFAWFYYNPDDRCEFQQGVADNQGNYVLGGTCQGTASFDSKTLPKDSTLRRSVLASLNQDGKISWANMTSNTEMENLTFTKDAKGRIHAMAHFYDTMSFGGKQFQSKGGTDILLLRLKADGSVEKSWQWGGTLRDAAHSISFWGTKALISGSFRSSFQMESSVFASEGGEHSFLAQIELN